MSSNETANLHVIVGRPRSLPFMPARRIYPTKSRTGVTLLASRSAPLKSWEGYELGVVRAFAKKRGWITWETQAGGFDVTPKVVGKEHRVDRNLLTALNSVASEGSVFVEIISGWRSSAKQLVLYLLFLAGKGNPANKPGTSRHEGRTAKAVDAYIRGVPFWTWVEARPNVLKLARKLGLKKPYAHEPWHVEVD